MLTATVSTGAERYVVRMTDVSVVIRSHSYFVHSLDLPVPTELVPVWFLVEADLILYGDDGLAVSVLLGHRYP